MNKPVAPPISTITDPIPMQSETPTIGRSINNLSEPIIFNEDKPKESLPPIPHSNDSSAEKVNPAATTEKVKSSRLGLILFFTSALGVTMGVLFSMLLLNGDIHLSTQDVKSFLTGLSYLSR